MLLCFAAIPFGTWPGGRADVVMAKKFQVQTRRGGSGGEPALVDSVRAYSCLRGQRGHADVAEKHEWWHRCGVTSRVLFPDTECRAVFFFL